MLFYEAGINCITSHEIFIITHEAKKIELQLAVTWFCGLISLLKFFGNEGQCYVWQRYDIYANVFRLPLIEITS